jgi:transcriptional repressor NrdR
MRCPICGKDHDKVVDSRTAQGGNIVRRRRRCLQCGHKFTTYEAIERIPLYVIKKDNRRELFQREKLVGGIITACKKRPVSMESIERLVHAIEMDIRSGFQVEVPSWKIGEFVINGLKSLDDVAYVRFASVYRQFKDAEEFIDELQKLKVEHEHINET